MKLRALLTLRSHCQRSQCSGHMKILSVSCIESLLFDRYRTCTRVSQREFILLIDFYFLRPKIKGKTTGHFMLKLFSALAILFSIL